MSKPFKGVVNVDIRDSEPDWAPFEPPKAPDGAPSVVYIVLDDVGFSAMSCYGGPIETPNIDKIAAEGVRYTQWHTTALCSPTRSCLLTGRNHTRNSMACITEAAIGFPNASGTIPPENGMLPEILGERGWNTYMVGKWHLCPEDEMNLASTRRNWPSGRGFERWYGFLGAETSQWYPDLVYDNHPVDQPQSPEEGYHLTRRPHRQGDRVHHGREGDRAREAVLPLLRARRLPRAAPRPEGVDRQVQGPASTWATRRCASRRSPARRSSGSSRRTPSCRRSTRSGRRRPAPGPTASRSRRSTSRGRGTRSRTTRRRCSAAWPRSTPGSSPTPTTRSGACSTSSRSTAGARTRSSILVSDNGASGEGGPNGSVNEMKFAQRHPRRRSRPTCRCSTSSAARRPTTTTRTAGRWRSTRRSRCGSATSSTAARATRASSPGRPG